MIHHTRTTAHVGLNRLSGTSYTDGIRQSKDGPSLRKKLSPSRWPILNHSTENGADYGTESGTCTRDNWPNQRPSCIVSNERNDGESERNAASTDSRTETASAIAAMLLWRLRGCVD